MEVPFIRWIAFCLTFTAIAAGITDLAELVPVDIINSSIQLLLEGKIQNGQILSVNIDSNNALTLLSPSLMLYDPAMSPGWNNLFRCPTCRDQDYAIVPYAWTHNEHKESRGRIVYGQNEPVYLVTRIYRCHRTSCRAKIRGTNADILKAHNLKLPVLLSHQYGVTLGLRDEIIALYYRHLSNTAIVDSINYQYRCSLERRCQSHQTCTLGNDMIGNVAKYSPQEHLVSQVIFDHELKVVQGYLDHTRTHKASRISIDHTFKTATIAQKKSGSSFTHEFGAVFIVLNEHGQVSRKDIFLSN